MRKISKLIIVSGLFALLSACSTDPIYLKNKDTGQVVKCGPYYVGLAKDFKMDGIAQEESQCINDYKEQGFVRNPGPT